MSEDNVYIEAYTKIVKSIIHTITTVNLNINSCLETRTTNDVIMCRYYKRLLDTQFELLFDYFKEINGQEREILY